ncbi:MAG TPA: dihydrolipoamide succinyltransferase [Deltaproteobacteria bacterium]|nr:dihydrolipoamide succinyltransferase [Deltaproteobacteria bacterium]
MTTDIIIPSLGESISEGTITTWLVEVGQSVREDQPLLELETDKVTAELPAPAAGVIEAILSPEGADVEVGAIVGRIAEGAVLPTRSTDNAADPAPAQGDNGTPTNGSPGSPPLSPAVRRMLEEHELDAGSISGTGKKGRILKGDVVNFLEQRHQEVKAANLSVRDEPDEADDAPALSTLASIPAVDEQPQVSQQLGPDSATPSTPLGEQPTPAGNQRRVPMTRLRRRIAERLKDVQDTAAILTTFNEVDMSAVMALRAEYKERFLDRHGVKLGFMSFFIKAAIEALKDHPTINACVEGTDIVYNDFYDIGVAVSSDRGLVVPVVRHADRLSFAELEKNIGTLAQAARDGKLTLEQLTGGTFTITNGGTFGSMLSTPILNPPQTGILGMHAINRRPVAVGDEIVIRPVMYLALSYDHRLIDGAQAVRFLVRIKELIEAPSRLLLET